MGPESGLPSARSMRAVLPNSWVSTKTFVSSFDLKISRKDSIGFPRFEFRAGTERFGAFGRAQTQRKTSIQRVSVFFRSLQTLGVKTPIENASRGWLKSKRLKHGRKKPRNRNVFFLVLAVKKQRCWENAPVEVLEDGVYGPQSTQLRHWMYMIIWYYIYVCTCEYHICICIYQYE